jgi:hypothetical protein
MLATVSDERVAGWVWPFNVRPLMEYLGLFVGYKFDGSDWQAVEGALPGTDDDHDLRYEYPLVGTSATLLVQLARDLDGGLVMVGVTGPMDPVLNARVDTLLSVMAEIEDTRRSLSRRS